MHAFGISTRPSFGGQINLESSEFCFVDTEDYQPESFPSDGHLYCGKLFPK